MTEPAFNLSPTASKYKDKTTRVHQMWQTNFTYMKIIGWGRYDAITDTYLKLDFNHEKLVKTVRNEHYSEFLEQIGRIRIRKSNQPLKGELNNLGFERIIEQILKDLGDYPN